jgi:hypothetical protein
MQRIGKVGRRKVQDKAAALDHYFQTFGRKEDGAWVAPCQICTRKLQRPHAGREVWKTDPCHKVRASQCGGEAPENILAGHRACHSWMDSAKARELVAVASPVSCATGGVVEWPAEMAESLAKWQRAFGSLPGLYV